MNKQILNTALAAAFVASLFAGCTSKNENQTGSDSTAITNTAATQGSAPSVAQGKYLVTAMGCNDCHTPFKMGDKGPEPDMSKLLSGHPASMTIDRPTMLMPPWMFAGDMSGTAYSGPWGVSFSANLTPDSLTGIGAWSQDVFVSAIRTGKHMGKGRDILPPMPWMWFKNLNDADLASIYMYLRSIPPISNKVPDPVPPPGVMPGMGGPPGGSPGAPPMPPMPPGAPRPPTGAPPMPHHHK